MIVKLLTEHHLEFLSLKGGCTCSSESKLVKMPYCWKSHALAHIVLKFLAYMLHSMLQPFNDFIYTTLTNFSTKYLMMCKVYTNVGGIK